MTIKKFNVKHKKIPYPNIKVKNGQIVKVKPDGGIEIISDEIKLENVIENIENGNISLKISFNYLSQLKSVVINRGNLNKKDLVAVLAPQGGSVFEYNAHDVIKHLLNQEISSSVEYVHEKIGWGIYKDNVIFKLHKAIGCESRYVGDLSIETGGTNDGWIKLF